MSTEAAYTIERVSFLQRDDMLAKLIKLLQDTVNNGASIGFLPPLSEEEARNYWLGIFEEVQQQRRSLIVACEQEEIVGTVQLELAQKPNALHRAEIQKLFVAHDQRRRGIATQLMYAIEEVAYEHGRTLLVLDTRKGDSAEKIYRKLGYIEAGSIPAYAKSANGTLDATIIFYKLQ